MTLICISNFSNTPPSPLQQPRPTGVDHRASLFAFDKAASIFVCSSFAPCIQNSSFTVGRRTRKPCHRGNGSCLLFTTIFWENRLEGKWNTTFWVFPTENFREQRNIWKGSPVFPDGMFQKEIFVFHFFKAIFDTSFKGHPTAIFGKYLFGRRFKN